MPYGYMDSLKQGQHGGLANAAAINKQKLQQAAAAGAQQAAQQRAQAGSTEAAIGSTLGTVVGTAVGGPVGGAIGGALGGAAGKAAGGGQVNAKEVALKGALGVAGTTAGQDAMNNFMGDLTGKATDAQIADILATESTVGNADNTDIFNMIDEFGSGYMSGGGTVKQHKSNPLSVSSVEYKKSGGKVGESYKVCYHNPLGGSNK